MKEATQPVVVMPEPPRLLIEWSSPWQEFLSAIGPALHRSPKRLAGEARTGTIPFPGMAAAWVFEAVLLVAAIVLQANWRVSSPILRCLNPSMTSFIFPAKSFPKPKMWEGPRLENQDVRAAMKVITARRPSGWRAEIRSLKKL